MENGAARAHVIATLFICITYFSQTQDYVICYSLLLYTVCGYNNVSPCKVTSAYLNKLIT